MIIEHDRQGEYGDVINSYYELERHNDGKDDCVLFQGYDTSRNETLREKYKDTPTRIYLNLEAPCAFASTNTCLQEQSYFTHVYTLCPYTCEFMNSHQTNTKFIPIPFPFSGKCFENLELNDKPLDAIYMGTMMCNEHAAIVKSIQQYNYNFASIYDIPHMPHLRPTMVNVSSQEKWNVLSKTKASVALNLCPINEQQRSIITSNDNWENIEAFNIGTPPAGTGAETGYIPQFKPRVIEAMCTKTVNLVKWDPWNVIERWFEPGKHFLYWDDIEDLQKKLKDVVENYENYESMVESAYERVYDFEIDKMFDIMKKGELVV